MRGIADARIEQRLLARVDEAPASIEELIAVARDAVPQARGREGAFHAIVHRLVRAGRIEAIAHGASGGATYARAGTAPPSSLEGPEAIPPPVARSESRRALKVASRVREPEDRGRVVADVLAHRAALAAAGRLRDFGSVNAARDLLRRVDRDRAALVVPENGWERVLRWVRHEGPSIAGSLGIMALLWLFVAEFRVVPSNSMRPGIAPRDRLVVWKIGAHEVPPRWSIVVFHGPDGRPLVKRVAGLPGEQVAVDENGDLRVDGEIARKPDDVRDAVREPLLRATFGARNADWSPPDRDGWRRYVPALWADEPFYFDPEQGIEETGAPPRPRAHDVYVTARVRGDGEVRLSHVTDSGRESQGVTTRVDDRTDERTVSISLVDGIRRAGASLLGVQDEPEGHAVVAVRGTVLSLAIDRDIHYTQPRDAQLGVDPHSGWRVPEGHLFMLGDHSARSRDSRYAAPTGPGPVPLDRVLGRVVFRVWPLTRIGPVR